MNWKKVLDAIWLLALTVLAIALIENEGESFIVEMAGDCFGALGLMYIAIVTDME